LDDVQIDGESTVRRNACQQRPSVQREVTSTAYLPVGRTVGVVFEDDHSVVFLAVAAVP